MARLRSTWRGGPAEGGAASFSACSNKWSGFGLATQFQLFFGRKIDNGQTIFTRSAKRSFNFDQRVESHVSADFVGTTWLKNDRNVQGFVALRIRRWFAEYALEACPPLQDSRCCLFYDVVNLSELEHGGTVAGCPPP